MNYFVINGFPQSGKDSFVNACKEVLGKLVYSVSTVDFIKEKGGKIVQTHIGGSI